MCPLIVFFKRFQQRETKRNNQKDKFIYPKMSH